MLPPRLRERTVRPKTWPRVFTTRVSGIFSVVVTIIGWEARAIPACWLAFVTGRVSRGLHGPPPLA
jgi:hypothetical protein